MRSGPGICSMLFIITFLFSCRQNGEIGDINIIYLHHSTGGVIWDGNENSTIKKFAGRISYRFGEMFKKKATLPLLFERYNNDQDERISIKKMIFPKNSPYGWNNFPYDYYNIWVKNSGNEPFMEEPTVEMLAKDYQVIVFKHCFPVCNIQPDLDSADINSDVKTIPNYKLQYYAIRDKLHEFPDTKFILFTGAVQVDFNLSEDEARRAREFFEWVIKEWDLPDDNIYLWDLYSIQTEGGLYFKDEYAVSPKDSHPNTVFAGRAANLLFNRIIDVIKNNGSRTSLTGEIK